MRADERRRLARGLWSAHEWFFTTMVLAAGGRDRELLLLATLRDIATGSIGQRDAGEEALRALERWREHGAQ